MHSIKNINMMVLETLAFIAVNLTAFLLLFYHPAPKNVGLRMIVSAEFLALKNSK